MLDSGTAFGRYAILGTLGKGGFATVYRARDQALDREVAIKLLLPHLAEDAEVRQRFVAEARGIARLRHPNIATIYDVGESDGRPFFTMELIEGPTLARLLVDGPLPPDRVSVLLRSLASAIDYLHGAGLVHRDIKPANIMLEDRERIVLMDFGIARAIDQTTHTRTGTSLGTPEYMSPEQVRGEHVGPASDIYALGVLTYHLLAGNPPFTGDTAYLLFAHVYETPPPLREKRPDLSEATYAAVQAALEKDPARRPVTAAEFAAALAAVPPATPSIAAAEPAGDEAGMVSIPRPQRFGAAAGMPGQENTRPTAPADAPPDSASSAPPTQPIPTTAPVVAAGSASPARSRGRWLAAAAALIVMLAGAAVFAVIVASRGGKQTAGNTANAPAAGAPGARASASATALSAVAALATSTASAAATNTPIGSRPTPAAASASSASTQPSVASAAPATAADPNAQKQLAAAALTEADLGAGYVKLDESTDLTKQAGITATYDEAFLNLDLSGAGVQIAAVTLDAYADAKSASAGLKADSGSAFADTGADVRFQPTADGPKLGDETSSYKVTGQSEGVDLTGYAILWRRGRYTAGVLLLGTAASSIDATTKLAQKQDDRLKSAAP